MTRHTRDQRIVAAYEADNAILSPGARLRSRVLDLPAMLRRHGLLQVISFLDAKKGKSASDGEVAKLLRVGIGRALETEEGTEDLGTYRKTLSELDLADYLRHQEAAVVAASWLKLLVEAHPQPTAATKEAGATDQGSTQPGAAP